MNKPAPPWWQVFTEAIDKLPPAEQAHRLAGLALQMRARHETAAAAQQALRAWHVARNTGSEVPEIVRRALAAVTPRYHAQISTDPVRLAAWQAALADCLRPGMLALEIGSGSGILAMLAARAGAEVVSCESNPVLAAVAQEIVRSNGLAGRIRIVGKPVETLAIPGDLPRPADLLLLDLFSDDLFAFKPFEAVRQARQLMRPDAIVVPMRASLEGALAEFGRWRRLVPDKAAGLDLTPLADIAPMRAAIDAADPDLVLRSPAQSLVAATLPDDMPPQSGSAARTLISDGGPVNGIVTWLRLELAPGHVLEARPGQAPRGFYARPTFFALRESLATVPGQPCPVRAAWDDRQLAVSLGAPERGR